ncbi:hypothetical protein CYMTET_34389 [Cymbomonas tetramitiformis]|uniref:Uncharacterized protein n=1 Tax=Cymbomonas tetramitiformis TaxID=36881 RepID=A0AAE0FB57_9CHLO|nr:hypothetical protein CYMTET_34389 [Cymbomonas tetramitiformis]
MRHWCLVVNGNGHWDWVDQGAPRVRRRPPEVVFEEVQIMLRVHTEARQLDPTAPVVHQRHEMDSILVAFSVYLIMLCWAVIIYILIVYATLVRDLMGAATERTILKSYGSGLRSPSRLDWLAILPTHRTAEGEHYLNRVANVAKDFNYSQLAENPTCIAFADDYEGTAEEDEEDEQAAIATPPRILHPEAERKKTMRAALLTTDSAPIDPAGVFGHGVREVESQELRDLFAAEVTRAVRTPSARQGNPGLDYLVSLSTPRPDISSYVTGAIDDISVTDPFSPSLVGWERYVNYSGNSTATHCKKQMMRIVFVNTLGESSEFEHTPLRQSMADLAQDGTSIRVKNADHPHYYLLLRSAISVITRLEFMLETVECMRSEWPILRFEAAYLLLTTEYISTRWANQAYSETFREDRDLLRLGAAVSWGSARRDNVRQYVIDYFPHLALQRLLSRVNVTIPIELQQGYPTLSLGGGGTVSTLSVRIQPVVVCTSASSTPPFTRTRPPDPHSFLLCGGDRLYGVEFYKHTVPKDPQTLQQGEDPGERHEEALCEEARLHRSPWYRLRVQREPLMITFRDIAVGLFAPGVRYIEQLFEWFRPGEESLERGCREGHRMEFVQKPPRYRRGSHPSCCEYADRSEADLLRSVLGKGVLEGPLHYEPWSVTPLGSIY